MLVITVIDTSGASESERSVPRCALVRSYVKSSMTARGPCLTWYGVASQSAYVTHTFSRCAIYESGISISFPFHIPPLKPLGYAAVSEKAMLIRLRPGSGRPGATNDGRKCKKIFTARQTTIGRADFESPFWRRIAADPLALFEHVPDPIPSQYREWN